MSQLSPSGQKLDLFPAADMSETLHHYGNTGIQQGEDFGQHISK